MKKKHYIALFHPVGEEVKTRIDFDSDIEETLVYELLKLEGYSIYQFILPDYQYVMSLDELRVMGIRFKLFEKERKTWFGLSKKIEQKLLIYPKESFFYPYQYGSYFYLFSKEEIKESDFIRWIEEQFPNRWVDFDDTLAGLNSKSIKLLHQTDYILVTNHDYQKEFGVVGSKEVCATLAAKLRQGAFESFETEEYLEEYLQNKE